MAGEPKKHEPIPARPLSRINIKYLLVAESS